MSITAVVRSSKERGAVAILEQAIPLAVTAYGALLFWMGRVFGRAARPNCTHSLSVATGVWLCLGGTASGVSEANWGAVAVFGTFALLFAVFGFWEAFQGHP